MDRTILNIKFDKMIMYINVFGMCIDELTMALQPENDLPHYSDHLCDLHDKVIIMITDLTEKLQLI